MNGVMLKEAGAETLIRLKPRMTDAKGVIPLFKKDYVFSIIADGRGVVYTLSVGVYACYDPFQEVLSTMFFLGTAARTFFDLPWEMVPTSPTWKPRWLFVVHGLSPC
jgi:hypothetical protein